MRRPPAVAALVAAALVFAAMALATKLAAARLPGPEIAFIRFLIGLAACAIAATRFRLRAHNKLGLFMRGAYGGAAVLFYFIGIALARTSFGFTGGTKLSVSLTRNCTVRG